MNWNNISIHTSLFMIELEEGVPFWKSPIGFNLGLTSIELSPSLQDEKVQKVLKSFLQFGTKVWVGVEEEGPILQKIPPIFAVTWHSPVRPELVDVISAELGYTYEPYHSDYTGLGYLPSRGTFPVREYLKDGRVFERGTHIGTEIIAKDPKEVPDWVIELVENAQQHVKCSYNHHKVSPDGTVKKAYVLCNTL
jgi:hypothetical protein